MQQSVIYQEWIEEGRQEGKREASLALVSRLLNRRIGLLGPEDEAQIRGLSLAQLEDLAEALMDFRDGSDFQDWLRLQSGSVRELDG